MKLVKVAILDVAVLLFCKWFILFPWSLKSFLFMLTVFILAIIDALIIADGDDSIGLYASTFLGGLSALIIIGLTISSFSIFHAEGYANVFPEQNESSFEEIISETTLKNIQIVDTDSAKQYGARTLGSCTNPNVLSQNNVSNNYSSIVVNGEPLKIAPLEYTGLVKAWKNQGIYGYVKVSPVAENVYADWVETKPFKYSPSAMFGHDLTRNIAKQYPSTFFYNTHLELTENEEPMWVSSTYVHKYGYGCDVITGVIVTDPYTGIAEKYDIKNVPEWVDIVYPGDYVETAYNWYGSLSGGWLNSLTSQLNCTQVTDDYGYIVIDNTLYTYTGITSMTTNDESNIGFLLTNLRTLESKKFMLAGAEEYSAMASAEQEVANFGYKASFPSLLSVNGIPTYVMVLKDENGLIKRYAMVNIERYDIVAVDNSLEAVQKRYIQINNGYTPEEITETENNNSLSESTSGKTTSLKLGAVTIDGKTYMCVEEIFVTDENGNVKELDLSGINNITINIE